MTTKLPIFDQALRAAIVSICMQNGGTLKVRTTIKPRDDFVLLLKVDSGVIEFTLMKSSELPRA